MEIRKIEEQLQKLAPQELEPAGEMFVRPRTEEGTLFSLSLCSSLSLSLSLFLSLYRPSCASLEFLSFSLSPSLLIISR